MSLPGSSQESLFAAGSELPDLLPEDDPMMIFSREVYPKFCDQEFDSCYSDHGRPAISPAFLSCVTLLQFREHLSDAEAARAVICRLDWKIALHLPVWESVSFDPSTLSYFRRRLRENDVMRLILEKTITIAQSMGFIRKRTNQRVDATHVISHVNRISTTDLLFRTVRCLVEEVKKKAPVIFEEQFPEYLVERYTQRFSSFGISKEKREDRMAEIVEDGWFIRSILEQHLPGRVEEFAQLAVMETVFAENVVINQRVVNERTMIRVEEIRSPKQSIFDPRDLSIQLGRKGKCSWVGSKCHVVETAERGKINFVTGMIYQSANRHDAAIHEQIAENNERLGLNPKKLYSDSNYVSGDDIQNYRSRGQELMGYIQDRSRREEAFRTEAFDIDFENQIAICPAGHRSTYTGIGKNGDMMIYFDRPTCRACTFLHRCVPVQSKKTVKRTLTLLPCYPHIRERRFAQKTASFRNEMRVRAQIEGTISEATRFHGLRHARYRGKEGHQLQFYLTGAALNVNRLTRAIRKRKEEAKTEH